MEFSRKLKILFSVLMLVATNVFAQTESALDETFRSNGKIYVVVAVLAVVLAVLFIYLISIDRKLKRTEDKLKNKY
ncbi:MAG: CcmD family protein [Bacteroidetes bacterium]|nr:CcmD family protein [Bacteroidota bacterium]MBX7238555.1 CcmD family protein [Bacteroidia bacterium]MCC7515408.1 CcmD family protein [Bacteroidia bacterium]MCW5919542.1 CcmD family protein [Bacteroidota bacterium]HMU77977.1 CcmD family protein [Bacteroidia bacterium]